MLTHKKLQQHYALRKKEVKKRLNEFSNNANHMSNNDKFVELCFCICTPQSKAVKVAQVINSKNATALLNLEQSKLAEMLRSNTRFHNNKAKHIVNARKFLALQILLCRNPIQKEQSLMIFQIDAIEFEKILF